MVRVPCWGAGVELRGNCGLPTPVPWAFPAGPVGPSPRGRSCGHAMPGRGARGLPSPFGAWQWEGGSEGARPSGSRPRRAGPRRSPSPAAPFPPRPKAPADGDARAGRDSGLVGTRTASSFPRARGGEGRRTQSPGPPRASAAPCRPPRSHHPRGNPGPVQPADLPRPPVLTLSPRRFSAGSRLRFSRRNSPFVI